MSGSDIQRDLGRLETEVSGLKDDMDEMKADVKAIRTTLAEAKGSWRTLLAIAGLAGTIGAVLAKVIPYIPWGR